MIAPFSFCQVALLKLSVRFDLVALDMCAPKMREAGDTQFTSNHWEQHEMHTILHFKPCNCYMQQVHIKDWSCADFLFYWVPFLQHSPLLAEDMAKPNHVQINASSNLARYGCGWVRVARSISTIFCQKGRKIFAQIPFDLVLSLLFSNCAVRM